jgi:phenylalanine-4-hydroxylase
MMPAEKIESPGPDFVIDQGFERYTDEEHEIWRTLFHRQAEILQDRAAPEFLDGLAGLGIAAEGIPHFERLSDILERATGWRIVAVPGLVPDDVFFRHLANRRFPATNFIRRWDQLDYLQEPDVFHDIYGHVPMLFNPIFADYLQAYGQGGLKALKLDSLPFLARLYWYTVEFGLVRTKDGLRIYGSGIVSSKGESIYALESDKPKRLPFDLLRIMQTDYRIDDFQDIYFVIDGYDQLFEATRPDFTPYYASLKTLPTIPPGAVLPGEREIGPSKRAA